MSEIPGLAIALWNDGRRRARLRFAADRGERARAPRLVEALAHARHDPLQHAHDAPSRRSRATSSAAAPRSSTSRARCTPSRGSSANPAATNANAALATIASRAGPCSPRSTRDSASAFCGGVPAANRVPRCGGHPDLFGRHRELAGRARRHFDHLRGCGQRDLVRSVRGMENERALRPEKAQRLGGQLEDMSPVDAHHLARRARRIRHGPQKIEDRARGERAARSHGVAHRGMEARGEEKAEAQVVDETLHALRLRIDGNPELFQYIRAAALRRYRAIAVLRDRSTPRRRHERRAGGDVQRPRFVAAGPARIQERRSARANPRRRGAHRPRRAHHFLGSFPFDAQCDQIAGDRAFRHSTGHDVGHRRSRRRHASSDSPARTRRNDSRNPSAASPATGQTSRKLPRIFMPSVVRIDSGWNCTPKSGRVRWRSPMIS